MSRRQQPRRGVRVLVATMLLAAIGGLFAALSTQLIGGQRADLRRIEGERQAVPYLRAVSQLIADLVESRSAAVRGNTDPAGSLDASVAQVSDMDGQLGATLLTTDEWLGLRSAIDSVLAERPTGAPASDRYTDLVTMATDLLDRVSTASGLSADPEPAGHSLVLAVRELSTLIAATSRAADLTTLAAADAVASDEADEADVATGEVEVAVALHEASSVYRALVTELTTSVDTGAQPPFTATVTEQLNRLHAALGPTVGRPPGPADPATLDDVARQVRDVARHTTTAVLDELDGELANRQAALRNDMYLGLGTAAAGFLLGLMVLWWSAAPPSAAPEPSLDALADGPDVASVSVHLPAVDARELLALEELVHVGRAVRARPAGGGDDAQ